MKIVSPFMPFAPESAAHKRLGHFDWIAALRMLRVSTRRYCHCETYALTDVDADLGVPAHHYHTRERRLMLWILEVSLRYLESLDFDQDTVMVSPDTLVFNDLARWFDGSDLGLLVRLNEKHRDKHPILNGVQWWARSGQDRLVAFYRDVLARARTLSEDLIRWGADTEPLVRLLSPLRLGHTTRHGLRLRLIDAGLIRPHVVLDFKGLRKHEMAAQFERRFQQAVPA